MPTHFEKGDNVGGVEILRQAPGEGTLPGMYYRVKHGCCGAEALLRHGNILDRVKKGATLCAECNRFEKQQEKNRPPAPKGVFDLKGFFWASLTQ